MSPSLRRFYAFGPFTLDTVAPLLWRDGEPVNLTPKSLETLSVLVQRAGQLVKREELMEAVWPDTVARGRGPGVRVNNS
jgi:DNA-binding winged helix-turn-helix (wHTH) protein